MTISYTVLHRWVSVRHRERAYSIVLICRFSLLSPYQWKFGSSFSTYLPSSSRSLSSSSRFSWYIIWHWHCCDTLRWCLWEFYSRLEIYYSAHLFFNLKQSDRLKLLCYSTLWAKYRKIVCDDKCNSIPKQTWNLDI